MANHCTYYTCEHCGEEYCVRCEGHSCTMLSQVTSTGATESDIEIE